MENGDSLDEGEDFNLRGGNDGDASGGEGIVNSAAGGRVSPGAEAKPGQTTKRNDTGYAADTAGTVTKHVYTRRRPFRHVGGCLSYML